MIWPFYEFESLVGFDNVPSEGVPAVKMPGRVILVGGTMPPAKEEVVTVALESAVANPLGWTPTTSPCAANVNVSTATALATVLNIVEADAKVFFVSAIYFILYHFYFNVGNEGFAKPIKGEGCAPGGCGAPALICGGCACCCAI